LGGTLVADKKPFSSALSRRNFDGGPLPMAAHLWSVAHAMRTIIALTVLALAINTARADGAAPSRVEYSLAVRGEFFSPTTEGEAAIREPIEVKAAFDFVETPSDEVGTTTRRYRRATAALQTGENSSRTTLAADAREVIVELVGTTPTPSLAEGFLSRQEAELFDTPFDPALLSKLAPESAVSKKAAWKVPADVVAGLLAIDTVTKGGIDVALDDVADSGATLTVSGTVTGAVDGVATSITVTGTATVPCVAAGSDDMWLVAAQVNQMNVTLVEKRDAGWVAPGLDVEATVTMQRSDVPSDPGWIEKHRLDPPAAGRPSGQGKAGTVWHRHPHGRYTLVLDRRWRVVEDGPEGLVMRLVDRGALVAQCSILPLPRSAPEAPPSVEQVSRDVERSLGDQFGHIATADASSRDDGTKIVRVMADGTAEGRPFRWIHQVLTDPAGHHLAVTCMLEPSMADRFGGADLELAAGLVLLDSNANSGDTPGLRSGRNQMEGRKLSR
jgi:hypothetical protein